MKELDFGFGDPDSDSNVIFNAILQFQAAKKRAAYHCVERHVKSGDRIGVGTGSTAKFVVDCLGEKFASRQLVDIKCVPTSFQVFW